MSRKLGILAGVLASGLGVAAIVNAQNATPTRTPSLSDRLSQIRDQLVGEDDGEEESRVAPATNQRRPTDWSAGRKFGAPSRPRTVEDERPSAPRHNVSPPAHTNASQPQRRAGNTAVAPRTATPNRAASEAPARKPAGNYAHRPDAARVPNNGAVAERAPVESTAVPPATSMPNTSAPTLAPRAVASGVATDSPLRNRLQALREERFDEAVSGDSDLTARSAPATKESSAIKPDTTTAADAQWRSAAPATKVEAPSAETPAAPVTASRYREDRPLVAKTDAAAADSLASSTPATATTKTPAAPSGAGHYANDRAGAAPNASAAESTTREAPAYVARRDAVRPSYREIAPGAAKSVESAKATRDDPSGGDSGALLASKSPVLSVKTVGPRTVTIGKPAKYELLLENSGDAAANEVLVTVKLPAWAQIEGAQATAGAAKVAGKKGEGEANDGLQWRVSRLDAGGKQRLVMQVVPKQSTPFQLAVQWTFEPEVAKTVVEVQEPKLQIALDGPKEMLYGAKEAYRITISNPGTGDAENVAVLTSGASPAEGMNKLAVGTLAAGATKTLELNIAATQAGTLHIAAKATADGNLSSQAAADVLVRRAALKLAAGGPKANYAGTQAAYEVRVANPGNATAENVRVEATLPIGAKFDKCSAGGAPASDGTKVVWTVPSLAAGSERAFELTCTLMAAGANRLQVAATAQGQLSDTAEVATRVEALADLKMEVADPRGPVAVGADAVYEVRIRNRGTKTAERINVVGFFSEGIEPISATGMKYTIETGQITFTTIDALDPNEEVIAKVTARATTAGNHLFRAELVCESTETRLVVEETTKFYADGPVKPAAYLEEAGDGGAEGAVEHAGGAAASEDAMPGLVPPAEGEDELQPLSLSTEVNR